jgi:hypothetical protein
MALLFLQTRVGTGRTPGLDGLTEGWFARQRLGREEVVAAEGDAWMALAWGGCASYNYPCFMHKMVSACIKQTFLDKR